MAYRFARQDASMQSALRRITAEQVAAAIAAIDDRARPRADAVHAVRKTCKKVRGLLRLVRPGLDGWRDADDAFRDIARGVSDLRDGDIVIATWDALAPHADAGDAAALATLRQRLAEGPRAGGTRASAGRRLARCRTALLAAADRGAHWRLEDDGFDALRGGLRRSYAQARDAMHAVQASPSDDAFHAWRKRAKDHWYHARLLQPIWPRPMRAYAHCAGELGEALGAHHDLAVFVQALARVDDAAARSVDVLTRLAHARQRRLARSALGTGRRLLAPRPKALARHWEACFDAWRAGD